MPSVTGAKLYLAAAFAVCMTLVLGIGDAPLSPHDQEVAAWVLKGISAGIAVLIGPELAEMIKAGVDRLAGKQDEDA